MPENRYNIGDKVYCLPYGAGYIVAQTHFMHFSVGDNHPACFPMYLVYFDNIKPHLSYHSAAKLLQPATKQSITLIQNCILTMFSYNDAYTPIKIGDIVQNYSYGEGDGIVLSVGHRMYHPEFPNHRMLYHVYYPNSQKFEFNRPTEFGLLTPNTPETKKQARNILMNKILMPLYSTPVI